MLNFLLNIFNSIKESINNLNKFNKTILFSAIVILIIVLIIIGVMLNYSLFNENYPPIISDCPDYWDVSLNSDNQVACHNIVRQNTGTCNNNTYPVEQFYAYASNPKDVICAKYKWAKECNISWDGITNNNQACQ
tara:strand:- start:48 stop:452 length:405 start_codon:yes stop_codon:yes gene_type:complete